MSETTLSLLLGTAATVGVVHTAIGIDHTLPFVVLARAQKWKRGRLWLVTSLCGMGHVLSSALLGLIGVGVGVSIERLQWIESGRGTFASWLLIGFGLTYATWGIYRHLRGRPHTHVHAHDDGLVHAHGHGHKGEHLHPHTTHGQGITAWTLFLILLFGPCEPVIPLMLVPATQHQWVAVGAVTAVFGLATVTTMLTLVTLGTFGLRLPHFRFLETHAHTAAGLAVAVSGALMRMLGI